MIERVLDTSCEVEEWVGVAEGVIEVDSDARRGGVVERVDDGDESDACSVELVDVGTVMPGASLLILLEECRGICKDFR